MGARSWFPNPVSPYRFAVNLARGGVIDTLYANSPNLIHNGPGDAFQMAIFDPDIVLDDDGSGYTQKGIYNPTQAGGGDPTRIIAASAAGDDITLQPALFEHHGLADLIWEQHITPIHSPNVWRIDFKSYHTGAHAHNRMHGKYQLFMEAGFTRVYQHENGKWQATDNPTDNVVRPYFSDQTCVLANPQTGLAFGLYKPGLNEWSVWSWWYTTQFGSGPELINWSGDNADSFVFFFGAVQECLQIGAALVAQSAAFPAVAAINKSGLHAPNVASQNLDGLYATPATCLTVWHTQRDLVPALRAHYPHARILVRAFTPNWTQEEPVAWAQSIAQWANALRPQNIEVTFANEQNMAAQGHPQGAGDGGGYPPASLYVDIRDWGIKVLQTLRPLIPGIPIHFPALAQGHSDDQNDAGYVGFEILRPLVEACDILDAHVRWNVGQGDVDSVAAGRRYEKLNALFPDKPIFISEYGGSTPDEPGAAEEYARWLDRIATLDYIYGATAFIWDTDDANHGWALYDKTPVVNLLRARGPQPATLPAPSPAPMPIPATLPPVPLTSAPAAPPAIPTPAIPASPAPNAPVAPPAIPVPAPVSGLTQPADPHLAGFPRPPDDNGRGLHFILDTRDDAVQHYAPYMKQMQIKWATVYGGDELQVTRVAKHLLDQCGTYSVLRVEARAGRLKFPDFWNKLAVRAVAMGLPPYIQLYNEPEIEFDNPDQFASAWGPRAQAIVAGGGYPGLQVMTLDFFKAVADRMTPEVKDKLFFVLHNYGANHPPSYPYSIGKTAVQDDTCTLRFLAVAEWCKQYLGLIPPMLGGEGGWLPGNHDDSTFPAVDYDSWTKWTGEMFDWFRTGQLSNGEFLPDYVFSINPWLLYASNWPSDSWVDGNDPDKKAPLVDRLTQDTPYVRRFYGTSGS
ncbi:MAG: hypothetical protein WCF84_25580 [Anaerolineae bacterium]